MGLHAQEWWVRMRRNGGSTWSGIYTKPIQTNPVKKDKVLEALITKYISKSKNKLIVLSRDNEEWIFDKRRTN